MSKAKYHVPQMGEVVEFTTKRGLHARTTVSSWDAKHGTIVSAHGLHYAVGDRSTIKPVAPALAATPKPVKVDAPDPGKSASASPNVSNIARPTAEERRQEMRQYSELVNACQITEPRPRTEGHPFRDTTATIDLSALAKERGNIEFVPATAPYTTTLPTSFSSEVERAQAIADAEAEETKRHEAADAKSDELAGKITALASERRDVMAEDENAQQDHENRLEYLRSLRVRQDQ